MCTSRQVDKLLPFDLYPALTQIEKQRTFPQVGTIPQIN